MGQHKLSPLVQRSVDEIGRVYVETGKVMKARELMERLNLPSMAMAQNHLARYKTMVWEPPELEPDPDTYRVKLEVGMPVVVVRALLEFCRLSGYKVGEVMAWAVEDLLKSCGVEVREYRVMTMEKIARRLRTAPFSRAGLWEMLSEEERAKVPEEIRP